MPCGSLTPTLKGVEDGEDVVRDNDQRSVTEEGEGPGDAEKDEQAQNGGSVAFGGALLQRFPCFRHYSDLPYSYNEYRESEEEHHGIITNVHPTVDGRISDPAPEN